jgi:hypothetical protein
MKSQTLRRFVLLISCAILIHAQGVAGEERLEITHGPYLVDPGETAMTVVWFTNKPCLSWVEYSGDTNYDTFPTWGGYPKIAKSSTNGLIDANTERHAIRIQDLEKGTRYRYRIHSKEILQFHPYEVLYGNTVVGEVLEFETLDQDKESFSFGAVTDVHERGTELDGLLQKAQIEDLDIMFLTGDILNWIGDEERIFDGFLDVSVKHFASEKPFVYVRGNHETRGPNARKLMSYFPHSSGGFHYSFSHGDVFFIVLDSGEDKPDTHPVYAGLVDFDAHRAKQAAWLKEEIQNERFSQSLYKVVLVHIPLFSGSSRHGASDLTEKIGPVLNDAGIDLMIGGHHHRFSRIEPREGRNRFPVVVLGRDMFLKTDVSQQHLSITITDVSGAVVDSFNITAKG